MARTHTRIVVEFPLTYDDAHWSDEHEFLCNIATYFDCVMTDDADDMRSAHYSIGRDPTVWISPHAYLADLADRWMRRRDK